jgi:hypothetical protein
MVCEVEEGIDRRPCWAEGAGTYDFGAQTFIMCATHLVLFRDYVRMDAPESWRHLPPGPYKPHCYIVQGDDR